MAKRSTKEAFKGMLHPNLIIEEFGKTDKDPSVFYSLRDVLEGDFEGLMVSITITSESLIPSLDESDLEDLQEDEE